VEVLEDRNLLSTITPTTFADGGLGSGSLRDAVLQFNADAGTDDDIIQLQAGTYALTIQNTGGHHETAGLEGDLNLTQTSHRWIIQGSGPSTIIDASQLQDRVFAIVTPGTQVVFRDLVIQGGLAQDDGSDGALAGTTDALGGGLLNNGGDVTLDNVVVENNVARGGDVAVLSVPGHNGRGGGVYSTGGALTIARATIANNQAIGGRGGDHNGFNDAGDGGSGVGGGLYASGGSLDILSSTIGGNRATGGRGGDGSFSTSSGFRNGGTGGVGQGGGVYVNGGSLTIASSALASNQATGGWAGACGLTGYDYGAGLYNGGTLTVSNSTLSGNTNFEYGGGISNYGTLTVTNTTLSGNTASTGGGIANAGMLTVAGSTLSGNSAGGGYDGGGGGGIYNTGTVTVSNSTLVGNSGFLGGGIINYSGTLTVSNSSLVGNCAVLGGGIENYRTLTVSNSTLSGNSAGSSGGGIRTSSLYPVTLTNVTLSANRVTSGRPGSGGGLSVYVVLRLVLHNTLIAGNFSGASGTTRDDVFGPLNSGGSDYNLIGDGTGMTGLQNGVNGNLVGSASSPIDPLLGPLQDNGGPTLTHALMPGSPAIDAGNNAYATDWDQRGEGFPRIVNGVIDIGAFEYQGDGSAPLFTRSVRGNEPADGTPFDVTVQAVDVFGQVAFAYTGTLTFRVTDTDPAVVLPLDYIFTADDQGRHTFPGAFTLITPGDQTLTVADLADGLSMDVALTVDA
jgi:hypothetical protein